MARGPDGRTDRRRVAAYLRPLTGLATVAAVVGVFAVAATLFRGGLTDGVPVTVLSPRAGLVMDPDAKVKLHGAEVGRVTAIEQLPNGQTALHLSMDQSALQAIPSNVLVDIASTTVFGAKFVQLVDPAEPSPHPMQAGQVIDAEHVTVEINTVFQQLTAVLSSIEPVKLNQTLGAIASALNGRGDKFGQMLSDLNSILAQLDPSLPALSRDLSVAPAVFAAYADSAPDLIRIADNATRISQTIVEQQHNLDTHQTTAGGRHETAQPAGSPARRGQGPDRRGAAQGAGELPKTRAAGRIWELHPVLRVRVEPAGLGPAEPNGRVAGWTTCSSTPARSVAFSRTAAVRSTC